MHKLLIFLVRYSLMLSVFMLLAGSTVYYFFWHWRPFTQNAFLFANTRPVSPLVEGYITEIYVRNNQHVKKGAPLFRTFRPPYALKCSQLEHQISALEAEVLSYDEKIAAAASEIEKAKADLANARYLSDRAVLMYKGAAVSQAYAEERVRATEALNASVRTAEHTKTALEHSRTSALATIRKLQAELELAKIYDGQTLVCALSDGYITNMSVSPGGYYRPGDILFGFVDTSEWFIQANLKESELSEIRKGQTARIWLWQYPEREFRGVVEEIGFNAERRKSSPETGLPVVEKENEWFLLPQRYPVQIRVLDVPEDLDFHVGGSAYVEIGAWARPVRQFFWQLFLWR